jgi:hypothetical protein
MYDLGSIDQYTEANLLNWLKNSIPRGINAAMGVNSNETGERNLNGSAMIYAISVEYQKCDESMEKLGFEKVYTAEKTHSHCREKDTGALTMWCTQPWVLAEKRKAWIAELENGGKPTEADIKKRQERDEFRIVHYQRTPFWEDYAKAQEKPPRIFRDDIFPQMARVRNQLFTMIETNTGWKPGEDTEILAQIRNQTLTWGFVKDRAIKWRNGEI